MVNVYRQRVIEVPKTLHGFGSWEFTNGSTTGEDFKEFAKLFKKFVRTNLPPRSIIAAFNSEHYILSGFIQREDRFVYFSISDVRHFPGRWTNEILVRTARDTRDFTGGMNQYTTLESFKRSVDRLLNS